MNLESFFNKLKKVDYLTPLKRMPLSVLSAVLITFLTIFLIWTDSESEIAKQLPRLVYFFYIVMLGTVAMYLIIEKYSKLNKYKNMFLAAAVAVSLILSFLAYPEVSGSNIEQMYVYRMVILWIFAYLLVFASPYLSLKSSDKAFWKFTYTVFLRMSLIFLSLSVFLLGIAGAFAAIDSLLDIQIDWRLFVSFIAVAYLFLLSYVSILSMPKELNEEVTDKNFPMVIYRITQFIFLPLLSIYLVILYLNLLQIIFTGEVPSNQLVSLTLSFLLPGLVSIILLYPLKHSEKYSWVKNFIKILSVLILPLMGSYFYGILVRVNEYGFTPMRFIVVLTGIFIVLLSFYLFFWKEARLVHSVIKLPIILLIFSFIPVINIFTISENNQYAKLIEKLESHGVIENSELTGKSVSLGYQEYYLLESELESIINMYGTDGLDRILSKEQLSKLELDNTTFFYERTNKILTELGITNEYTYPIKDPQAMNGKTFNIQLDSSETKGMDIGGFSQSYSFYINPFQVGADIGEFTKIELIDSSYIKLSTNDIETVVSLEELVNNIVNPKQNNFFYYQASREDLTIDWGDYRLYFESIQGSVDENKVVITEITGVVLVR